MMNKISKSVTGHLETKKNNGDPVIIWNVHNLFIVDFFCNNFDFLKY